MGCGGRELQARSFHHPPVSHITFTSTDDSNNQWSKENSFGSFLRKTWSLSLEPCSQDQNLCSSYQQLNPSHDPKVSMDVSPPTLPLSPPPALIFSFHDFSPLHGASLRAIWSVFLDYTCPLKLTLNYTSSLLRLKRVQQLHCMLPSNWWMIDEMNTG